MAIKEKLQEYALLAEVISAIAIVVSLIFVGLQIQSGSRETRAATILAISNQAMDYTMAMASDEHIPRLIGLMANDGVTASDLSQEDYTRLRLVMVAGLRRLENLYLQIQEGVLEPSALESVSIGLYKNAFVRELWRLEDNFDQNFIIYMNDVLAE